MLFPKTLVVCLSLGFVTLAGADVLESWGDGTPGEDFLWNEFENKVTILHGNALNYKFWVHDGSEEPGTGVIDNITVDANAVGDFTLLIEEEQGGPGALHWNEGDVRYAGGTSTVTGVNVTGVLGASDKSIHLERVDGSIDAGGSPGVLYIDEWLSASPAYIHFTGDAHSLILGSACAADIVADGDLDYLEVQGDLSGSVDIDGWGYVYIFGDVVDSGDNHVRIGTLRRFVCNNMGLSSDPERWLTFGPEVVPIPGNVTINGTLAGVVRFRGRYAGNMTVGTIDAGPTGDANMQYGGIYFQWGSEDGCSVIITDSFKQGWIFGENVGEAAGGIDIWGDLGQESPATVARILTGTAETDGGVPVDFGWDVFVCGDVWPSADGAPVIYSAGDLTGYFEVGNPEWGCWGAAMPGVVIQIEGSLLVGSAIQLSNAPMPGEVLVGGDVYSGIGMAGLAPSGYIRVNGNVEASGLILVASLRLRGRVEVLGDLIGQILVQLGGPNLDGGRIHIYGSLRDGPWSREIYAGGMISNAAIAIDYDGWDPGDEWEPGAVVRIAGDIYTGNTPDMNIWEIQRWRGDMNNDGALNDADADPFLLALTQPAEYELQYPGLEGSRVYHGDCNCDGVFDREDIPLFTFLYKNNCYTTDCINIECPDYLLTPPEAAAAWEDALDPALRPVLLGVIRAAVDEWGEDEPGPFWQEVLAYLED